MKRILVVCILAAAGAGAATPALAQPSSRQGASEQSFRDKYGVLTERNIFSRARTSPSRRREAPPPPVERPPDPEDLVVLTGTVQQGPARLAFVEERGRTIKVREGDEIARGKVGKIGFNVLEFEKDGKKVVVAIGKSFSGKEPSSRSRGESEPRRSSSPAAADTSASSSSAPSTASAEAPASGQEPPKAEAKSESSGGASDILERMRRRRLEEEQKK
jgi:hypothetical protein